MTLGESEAVVKADVLLDPAEPGFDYRRYPFYLLARAAGRYNRRMEASLKALGLDQGSWRVLIVLCEHEALGVAQIAEIVVYKLSTTTRIVQRLLRAGLVTCEPSRTDGRVTTVTITEEGRVLVDRSRPTARDVFGAALDGVSREDVETLCTVLAAIDNNLKT